MNRLPMPVRARAGLAVLMALMLLPIYGLATAALGLATGLGVAALGPAEDHDAIRRSIWLQLPLIVAEFALALAGMFVLPGLVGLPPVPHAMLFHSPAVLPLFALMAVHTLGERPAATRIAGSAAVVGWGLAGLATLREPITLTKAQVIDDNYDTLIAYLGAVMQPRYFSLDALTLQLGVLGGCAVVLGIAAWRARSLAREAGERQAALTSLSAHFAAPVAEALLSERLDRPERTHLAVLDCDLMGFSSRARSMQPEAVAVVLRAFHGFVEERVFAEGGAVLKFVGDGVIAVFGLTGDTRAAAQALACAERLAAEWPTAGAEAFGAEPPILVVGVDYGEATAGIVGEGRALTLIVAGPVVDGAARLQAERGPGTAQMRASPAVLVAAHSIPGTSLVTSLPLTL